MQKTPAWHIVLPIVIGIAPFIFGGFAWFIKLEVSRSDNEKTLQRQELRIATLEAAINGANGQPGINTQLSLIIEQQKYTNMRLDELKKARGQ